VTETIPTPSTSMRRTDTVLPLDLLNPTTKVASNSVTGKRGRPPKAKLEEPAEKKAKVEIGPDGKPLTGKGSGRKGGPGRGKKGPKAESELQDSSMEEPESETQDSHMDEDSQAIEVPQRGRQGTKFAKPTKKADSAATPEAGGESSSQEMVGRRSTRTKKTA